MSQYINSRSKLLQHIDRVAALKTGHKPPPVNIEIDLSNRCSLGCEWCHFAHTHTRGPHAHARTVETGDLMDTALAFEIVDQLIDYGVRSIVWSGGGEPTLHSDFNRIVNAYHLPMGLYTNGCHIDEQRAHILKQRLSWVYVSLDAVTGGDYAQCKGVTPEHFDRALAGVSALVNASGKATIGVGFLLNANNWPQAEGMAELGHELGADYVQFRPTIRYKSEAPNEIDGGIGWIPGAISLLETMDRNGVEIDLSRFDMLHEWTGHGYSQCWWSGLQTVITPNGKVWACLNKRGMDGAELGDLNDESFETIWERAPIQVVNDHCRVMCRGHIPNMELKGMFEHKPHGEFI